MQCCKLFIFINRIPDREFGLPKDHVIANKDIQAEKYSAAAFININLVSNKVWNMELLFKLQKCLSTNELN